ncbi:MAG: glycosyl hydrolase family 18 protein [Demequina sp.]|uniref:glycosyl hydrolase family 18 protein n=1 Tax=Demequina sp. TaxID=2050685 RepID=UPI003A844091
MTSTTSPAGRAPWGRFGAMVASLALAGTVAFAASASAAPPVQSAPLVTQAQSTDDGDSEINGFRSVGYFAQWGIYGRNYKLADVQKSGTAENLTHLNYAFGNIHYQNGTCFIANKAQGTGPNGSDGAGDAWADFGRGFNSTESVAGTTDTWDQKLAGNFNQLKQLKEKNPDLKVMISLGGWTWSKNFSTVAATQASREKFVSSCVDLYIKGNLPVIDGRGGTGAAAGVFDGIDIDWEWPGSTAGEVGNHVDEVNDAANFRLLLAEFRKQLDAYGTQTGEDYLLSAFLPASPAVIEAGGWNDPRIFESLDYGNVQGYDLHGAWSPSLTGHQANLYDDPADTRAEGEQFSVDKAVNEYLSAGIAPEQLGMGLAQFGRGWKGATSADAWGTATGAGPGTWEAGNEDYSKLKNLGTAYYDADIVASWRYDGNQWWSIDDAKTVAAKADYIRAKGLGGGMFWELDGDREGELPQVLIDHLGTGASGPVGDGTVPTPEPSETTDPEPTPEPSETTDPEPTPEPTATTDPEPTPEPSETTNPGECIGQAWSATTAYPGGSTVTYDGQTWKAKWYANAGDVPGGTAWGAWESLGECSGDPEPTPEPTAEPGVCAVAWDASTVYRGGETVTYGGHAWLSKWYRQGVTPGSSAWDGWEDLGAC